MSVRMVAFNFFERGLKISTFILAQCPFKKRVSGGPKTFPQSVSFSLAKYTGFGQRNVGQSICGEAKLTK